MTRKFVALVGMPDQSLRVYITQYTQVNALTHFTGVTRLLLGRRNYLKHGEGIDEATI